MSTLAQHASTYRSPHQVPSEDRVTALVHTQYNSPLGLYSVDNIAESIIDQAKVLTNGTVTSKVDYRALSTPVLKKSEVYRFLQEEKQDAPRAKPATQNPGGDPIIQSQAFIRLQKSLGDSGSQQSVTVFGKENLPVITSNVAGQRPHDTLTSSQLTNRPFLQINRPTTPAANAEEPRRSPQSPQPLYQSYAKPFSPEPQSPQIKHSSVRAPITPQQHYQSNSSWQQQQNQGINSPLKEQIPPWRQSQQQSFERKDIPNSPQPQQFPNPLQKQQAPWRAPQKDPVPAPSWNQGHSRKVAEPSVQSQGISPVQEVTTEATMAYTQEEYQMYNNVHNGGINRAWPPQNQSEQTYKHGNHLVMSPGSQRRRPVWPPVGTQENILTSTQSVHWSTDRASKQFIWPPPKNAPNYFPPDGMHYEDGLNSNGYPCQSPPLTRSNVPRNPQRLASDVWNPQNQDFISHSASVRPGRRPRMSGDVIYESNATPLPPTYRTPPGTQHVDPYAQYPEPDAH